MDKIAFIRMPEVMYRTGLSRSAINLLRAEGAFPKSVKIGKKAMAFIESEVDDWMEEKIKASRGNSES